MKGVRPGTNMAARPLKPFFHTHLPLYVFIYYVLPQPTGGLIQTDGRTAEAQNTSTGTCEHTADSRHALAYTLIDLTTQLLTVRPIHSLSLRCAQLLNHPAKLQCVNNLVHDTVLDN